MSKIRVAVLRGGLGDEHKVSLWTGASVLEHIDQNLFDPVDVIITQNGEWLVQGKSYAPEHILMSVDMVFNALHGEYGEDGTVQRVLDRYGVPYTGSKAYASSIAMNKVLTKEHLKGSGIRTPEHFHVTRNSENDIDRVADCIVGMFGPEYVIKPVSSGSSVGTMMVKNPLLLKRALSDSLKRFEEVMVEVRIPGREATCGVVERYRDQDLYALPPIEIVPPPHDEFFSHASKYDGMTEEICPARFDHNTKQELERIAKLVHESLNLSQYSRSDFIVGKDDIYFLEVNTLPGLTKESLFPKAIHAVGGTYTHFITHLLTDTLKRRREK
jgi:D-alanine-D-alanine ligase